MYTGPVSSAGQTAYVPSLKNHLAQQPTLLPWRGPLVFSLIQKLAKAQNDSRIDSAEIYQPAFTAVQLALSWGVALAAVVGRSGGEIAATYAAKLMAAVAVACSRRLALKEVIAEGSRLPSRIFSRR
ncbi:hypothetical protein PG996_007696 [Apiospora saccharicola]|uniref:Uncharacterized protein n=1 Tax=Apiospora saccharicola TaxID=335842 RepID=A0ABR1VF35_9PEZI